MIYRIESFTKIAKNRQGVFLFIQGSGDMVNKMNKRMDCRMFFPEAVLCFRNQVVCIEKSSEARANNFFDNLWEAAQQRNRRIIVHRFFISGFENRNNLSGFKLTWDNSKWKRSCKYMFERGRNVSNNFFREPDSDSKKIQSFFCLGASL